MKKSLSLILALVFVLGIAGTAFAANSNPFTDVPANHWAYGAVKQLAKAGIIDGMGDGSFQGNKTVTRYEMAQIVAKAMAKEDKATPADKAVIAKLQAEFATELNNLGVRVANLEKKVGNIKLTADARIRYISQENSATNPTWGERWRLAFSADVNDKTSFYGRLMLMNHNEFGATGTNDTSKVVNAAFTTKDFVLKNTDLTVGRYDLNIGQTLYFSGGKGMTDGVQANIKRGKASLMGGYAGISGFSLYTTNIFDDVDNIGYTQFNYAFNKNFKIDANYIKSQRCNQLDIIGAGLSLKVLPNIVLVGDYWKNSGDYFKAANGNSDPTAYVARLAYKGANVATPGSWGMAAEYLNADVGSISTSLTGANVSVLSGKGTTSNPFQGVKAWDFQVSYAMANNILLEGFYEFNMKDPLTGAALASDKYTRLQVNYMF
ncbi:MAG: omp-alpha 4 [Firmicutes bacterium]|nr:omp-alpha 4 [Bacillota bacterium]